MEHYVTITHKIASAILLEAYMKVKNLPDVESNLQS